MWIALYFKYILYIQRASHSNVNCVLLISLDLPHKSSIIVESGFHEISGSTSCIAHRHCESQISSSTGFVQWQSRCYSITSCNHQFLTDLWLSSYVSHLSCDDSITAIIFVLKKRSYLLVKWEFVREGKNKIINESAINHVKSRDKLKSNSIIEYFELKWQTIYGLSTR